MSGTTGWEEEYARRRLLLLAGALARSVVSVHPVDGAPAPYFRAIARAVLAFLVGNSPRPVEEFLDREIWVRYEGLSYFLTRQTLFGYYLHAFEPRTAHALLSMEGEVFVDVGANAGQYTIPLASRFETVVAVEPNPVASEVLRQNLLANRIRNVEVISKALAPRPGAIRLYPGRVITTWTTTPRPGPSIEVPAITLDEVLRPFSNVDLLKIDVEGHESEVLLSSSLLQHVREICFACTPDQLPPLASKLSADGFTIHQPASLLSSDENYFASRPPAQHTVPAAPRAR
jgi:FkbM family methyltransferase